MYYVYIHRHMYKVDTKLKYMDYAYDLAVTKAN